MGRIPNHDLSCQTKGIWKTKCYYCGQPVYRVSCTCASTAILNNSEPPWNRHDCIEKKEYINSQNLKRLKEELRIKEIKDKYLKKDYVKELIINLKGLDSGNAITDKDLLILKTKKVLQTSDILYDNLFIKIENDKHVNGFCQENFIVTDFKYKKELDFSDNDTIFYSMIIEYNTLLKQFVGYEILISKNEFKIQKIKTGSYCEIHFNSFEVNGEFFLKAVDVKKYRKKLNHVGYEYVDLRK